MPNRTQMERKIARNSTKTMRFRKDRFWTNMKHTGR
jgi:hypothetical protein